MRTRAILVTVLLAVCLATSASAVETQAFRFKEDFGVAPLQGCTLQYYYYIPCPTYSWFWAFYDWEPGDVIGEFFTVGDQPTGLNSACDPGLCHDLTGFSFIDFAGYGTAYPGLFTVEFEVYCCDEFGCPIGTALWNSGAYETVYGWNSLTVDPPVIVTDCSSLPGPSAPRFLVAARHIGTDCTYPQWGFDNISGALSDASGCSMHDIGCLSALYPRPQTSHYDVIHSGYFGIDFEHCPPWGFLDGADTTTDGSVYGFVELAWKIALECNGPATQPTTWGNIKSMYR
jgi:hypothetical protein